MAILHVGTQPVRLQIPKDPDEILDYLMTWGSILGDQEIITSSSWTVTEFQKLGEFGLDSVTIDDCGQPKTYTKNQIIMLGGGRAGFTGCLTNRIRTEQGPVIRFYDRTFELVCRQR